MLYFYDHPGKRGVPNLGDDLNEWLIPAILGRDALAAVGHTVVGIGTILNSEALENLSTQDTKLVYTSGVGYAKPLVHDESWSFFAVRGVMTRQALNLASEVALGDGAILIADHLDRLELAPSPLRGEIVFMPHVDLAEATGKAWRHACDDAGVAFMSPAEPRERLIAALAQARLIITSAMHGAIIADALRTPWLAVASPEINTDKWQDWGSALDMTITFTELPSFAWISEHNIGSRFERRVMRGRIARRLQQMKKLDGRLSRDEDLFRVKDGLRTAAQKLREAVVV